MSGSYDFCITRQSSTRTEQIHVRLKYGDIDPSKEVARVIVQQRYTQADTKALQVSDYSPRSCPGPAVEEITVSASLDQIQRLMNALGRGDMPGAFIVAADMTVGGTVAIVKGAGNIVGKAGKVVGNAAKGAAQAVGNAAGDVAKGAANAAQKAGKNAGNFLKKPFG